MGYEALARFPGFTEKNPEAWFAAARSRGKGSGLEVVAFARRWRRAARLPPNCFLTAERLAGVLRTESIRRIWREQGDLAGLVVELTEQTPIDSYSDWNRTSTSCAPPAP